MFLFLQYIRPLWYYWSAVDFNKNSKYEEAYKNYLNLENGFDSIIGSYNINRNVSDNYLFLKSNFGYATLFKIFFLRGFTGFYFLLDVWPVLKVIFMNTKKITLKSDFEQSDFLEFNSELIKSEPLVSVIIPTLNRYLYLKDVILDLSKQSYKNFEVIICDQSSPVDKEFYSNCPIDIVLIEQKEKALWLARNRCIEKSRGEYLLFFDDDSRVEKNWIENHLKALDYFKCSVSAGVTKTILGNPLSNRDDIFRNSDVFDTGNAMVEKTIFLKVGLFDLQFEKQRMGDGEFGNRLIKNGIAIVSNPLATRLHLKVSSGGLRQMHAWDAFRTGGILTARPIPSVLYYARNYFKFSQVVIYLLQNLPFAFIPFRYKNDSKYKLLYLLLLPLTMPLLLICLSKSINSSSQMLRKGPLINFPKI